MKLPAILSLSLFAIVLAPASALVQCEVKLTASDLWGSANFGSAVALQSDTAIIGAPGASTTVSFSGAAYVFERNGAGWVEVQKLEASDAAWSDHFGVAVALDGSTLAVSAPYEDPQGVSAAGSVYIFEKTGGTWIETAKLWASDGTSNDFFGRSIALLGDRLVVGVRDDSSVTFANGSVYIFDRVGGVWSETQRLVASDAQWGDTFGTSVATWGDLIVVGAPEVDDNGSDSGAAYVFELTPAGWAERAKLWASDGTFQEWFGWSVAISSYGLLAGAHGHSPGGASNAGAVYAFEHDGSRWVEVQKLTASDAAAGDRFGASVAMWNDTALIGAPLDGDSDWGSGAAYFLRRSSSGWQQTAKFVAHDGEYGDFFGFYCALSGDTALLGAHQDDDACPGQVTCNSGAAYVFDLAPTAVQYCSCQMLSPCGNVDGHGGCVNSTGRGAELLACGSGSVASDDLMLVASRLPPNKTGLIYMGGKAVQLPFGDGQRCVGAGTTGRYLFQVRNSGPEGVITLGPGIAALSQGLPAPGRIDPGETWYFQCWFRDSQGPCGTRFNLSNGVAVTFGP